MPRSTRSRATTARRRAFPGFRPGKVPAKVVRQRFRDQILHDVAHGLIPRAVDEALRERGVEPVDTPDIRDVVVEEGQPLKFTATSRRCRRSNPATTRASRCTEEHDGRRRGGRRGADEPARARGALRAGRGARDRAWRLGRDGSGPHGDAEAGLPSSRSSSSRASPRRPGRRPNRRPTRTTTSRSRSARPPNPPGFDEELHRPERRARRRPSTCDYPDDYAIAELAGTTVSYAVTRQGDPQARRPGARRRVREGPRGLREPRRRCARACATTSSTRRRTSRSATRAASC